MQQAKAAQHYKKSSKQKNDNNKRSRGHSLTGTVSTQLMNYAKNDQYQIQRADEPNLKIKKQKILRPEDLTVHILQRRFNFQKLSVIELAESENEYGVEPWLNAHTAEAIKDNNIAAGEIKGQRYEMENQEAEEVNLTTIPEGRRPFVLQANLHQAQLVAKELATLKPHRRKLIAAMFNSVSPEIKEIVEAKFPNWMNNPDVVHQVALEIESVYELQNFEGRKDKLEQQVTVALSDYFSGSLALKNLAKNGKVDLNANRRLLVQLLRFAKIAGMPEMTDAQQAKYFVYSLCHINYLKEFVERIMTNESEYNKMPTGTEAELHAANTFRILSTLAEAYKLAALEKDRGIVYQSDLVQRAGKNQHYEVQRATVQDTNKNKTNKKRKTEQSSGDMNESNIPKTNCLICKGPSKNTHDTLQCRFLSNAVLAFHIQQDANKNKNSSSKPTEKADTTENKTYKKQYQKKAIVVDDESDQEDENDQDLLKYLKSFQRSNVLVEPQVFDYWNSKDGTLTQFDNGCSEKVQEFCKTSGLTAHRKKTMNSFTIKTTNGTKVIDNAVTHHVKGFGECLYNPSRGLNLVSQAYCEKHYKVEAIKNGNVTVLYKVYLDNYGVILEFHRQPCGIYVGSLAELLNKEWQEVPAYYEEDSTSLNESYDNQQGCQFRTIKINNTVEPEIDTDLLTRLESLAIERAKDKVSEEEVIKIQDKRMHEYSLSVVQPNLGFIAPRSFETMVNKGMIMNLPDIPANAIRVATEKLGPTMVMVKSKTKATKKKAYLRNYVETLEDNDRILHIDFVFLQELVFLLGVYWPGYLTVGSYVGYGEGCRESTVILPHLLYIFSIAKAMKKNIKYVSADGEGGFEKLKTEIQANAGLWIPLNRGEHSFLDNMVSKIKSINRAISIDAGYDPPRPLLVGFFKTGIYWANHDPNTGNPANMSPMMHALGLKLDYKKHSSIRAGQLFEVKRENPLTSSTVEERTVTAFASHPKANGWEFYNYETGKAIRSQSYIPRPHNEFLCQGLTERRSIEREELKRKPNQTVTVAVQSKKVFDWKKNNFHFQVEKYGDLNAVLALKKELQGLIEIKKSFHPVHIEDLSKTEKKGIAGIQALFNPKPKDDETVVDLKARVVVKGNEQDATQFDQIEDIKSPTVQVTTIFLNLVTAAMYGKALVTIDLPQAFLNAAQDRVQHAKFPKILSRFICVFWPEYKDFVRPDGTIIVRLDKALYGQIQAPRLFNKLLVKLLLSKGYKQNHVDLGMFSKVVIEVTDTTDKVRVLQNTVTVCTHVDDLKGGVPPQFVTEYIEEMKEIFGDDITIQTNLGKDGKPESLKEVVYLGMVLSCDYEGPVGLINPKRYFGKMLPRYDDIIQGKVKRVPSKADFLQIDANSPKLTGDILDRFKKMIYEVRYSVFMADEILFHSAWFVRRISQGLTEQDKEKFIHFIRYINGRKELPKILGPNRNGEIELSCFSDANHDLESYSSTVISPGRGALSSYSHRQKEKQIASTHHEIVAASESVTHGLHAQHLCESMEFPESWYKPCKFYEDNYAVILLMKNGRSTNSKSKHIHMRHFFMKQYFDNKTFEMIHCITDKMVADINTKPKVGEAFLFLRDRILGYEYIYE